jgi:hypothetical protein
MVDKTEGQKSHKKQLTHGNQIRLLGAKKTTMKQNFDIMSQKHSQKHSSHI